MLVCQLLCPAQLPPSADDTVEERKLAKSVSCGKTFRGRQALRDLHAVHTWLLELGGPCVGLNVSHATCRTRRADPLLLRLGSFHMWQLHAWYAACLLGLVRRRRCSSSDCNSLQARSGCMFCVT